MPDNDIPRKLSAAAGLAWIKSGFALYRKNPLLLGAGFGAFFALMVLLGFVPVVGGALTELISPILIAGFMAAFRALDQGEELELPHFFAGFTRAPLQLATVGAIYLAVVMLTAWLALRMGFSPSEWMKAAQQDKIDPQTARHLMQTTLPALLLAAVVMLPAFMATWFAPPLILFGGAAPLQALAISLKACLHNWLALFVYSLAITLVLFLGMLIPFMLGLLVAGPILFGSLYASYQAIFAVWTEEGGPAPAASESGL